MAQKPKILAFAGSARTGSYNKKLVNIAADGARKAGADVTILDLKDLPMPLFGEDFEASLQPNEEPNAKKFKDLMRAHDGFLISSPENNWSISALLKNAIDWASRRRPDEKPLECFVDKVVVLMSASPGPFGGIRALPQVAMQLRNVRCIVLPDQVCLGKAAESFNEDGTLKDAKQQAAVEALGARLATVVAKLTRE
jgi:NAD(P)H-dependent FMN reductase